MSTRITYLGHATTLIELGETRLLTDPVLRPSLLGGIIKRAVPVPDTPVVDAVLVSHQHPDHLDLPSLRTLGDVPVIAPRGAGARIRRSGISSVRELSAGDTVRIGDAEITATPAEHDGRRIPLGPSVAALGYEIRAVNTRIYFAGDTDLFDDMSELAGVDVALLPMGGWGPKVGKGHLDPERAIQATAVIRPRTVIPIHWGTLLRRDLLRRKSHLLTAPAEEARVRFAEHAPHTKLEILTPGATLEL